MFNDKDNANKVPVLLQEIYSKVAGESADMSGIAEYPNDTKVSMLLERIATALEGGGGTGGGAAVTFTAVFDSEGQDVCSVFSTEDSAAIDAALADGKMVWLQLPAEESYSVTAATLLVIGSGVNNYGKVLLVLDSTSFDVGRNYILYEGVKFNETTHRYYVSVYVD